MIRECSLSVGSVQRSQLGDFLLERNCANPSCLDEVACADLRLHNRTLDNSSTVFDTRRE